MKINKQLSNNKNHFHGVNPCNFITIHQTGNTRVGANAINHARYINGGSGETWHYTVDDKQVVQHFNDRVQCWHSGDGKGAGNTQSIGIELCVNSDGNYHSTIKNAVDLVKYLMRVHNIPIQNVVQHNRWSGKDCPSQIRKGFKGVTWSGFIDNVKGGSVDNSTVNSNDITDLARRTIRGEFGNGVARRDALGNKYHEVQKEVNRLLR